MRLIQQGNFRIEVLQETNITRGVHTQYSAGYQVWAMEAESRHWGGIAVIWIEEAVWQIEVTTSFGPNMVSFTITSGRKHVFHRSIRSPQ